MLSPQSGGGGTATPAGSTGDIQFNTAGSLDADTGQLYWDASNNRMGLGTGTPAATLQISGSLIVSNTVAPTAPILQADANGVGIGAAPLTTANLHISSTATVTTGNSYNIYNYYLANPTSSPNSTTYRGQYTYASYASNQTAVNSSIRGAEFYGYKTGSGNVSATYGLMAYSSARGGGFATTTAGVYALTSIRESTSTNTAYGIMNQVYDYTGVGSGGISTSYVYYGAGYSLTGSVTNFYGLYLTHSGTNPTNMYGVYVAHAGMNNYFAGKVGIGTNTPGYPLEVVGVVEADGFFQASDARLKTNIAQIESGLSVIQKLRPVTFDWKATRKHSVGLIAQEVSSVIPSAVSADTSGTLSVEYTQVIPYLVKGMQELKAENDTLKTTNQQLEQRLKRIEERMGAGQ